MTFPKPRKIETFDIEGTIGKDEDLLRLKEQFVKDLELEMKGRGYLRLYDLDPRWITVYNPNGTYDFYLAIYGSYVGKTKAQEYAGITAWRFV